jgi:glycerol-3-phosphate dehydrogenase
MVGTDYEPADSPPTDPRDFLETARRAFPWAGLDEARVTLLHEGLVPGRRGASGLATRPRVHDHESEDGLAGLVSLQGVKYTTGRAVAERGIDLVLRRLGRSPVPSRTAHTVLAGARVLTGPLEGRAREAVREEMALTLSDAVLRRLDLGTGGPPAPSDLDVVCGVMSAELGWDPPRQHAERAALTRAYPLP